MKYIEKTAYERYPKRIVQDDSGKFIDLNKDVRDKYINKIEIKLIYKPLLELIKLDVEDSFIERKIAIIERDLDKVKKIYSRLYYKRDRKGDDRSFYSILKCIKELLRTDDRD